MAMSRFLGRQAVHHAVADGDLAAGDFLQPGQHAQQRGFAAAGRTHQHRELAIGNIDADAPYDLRPAKGLLHIQI
jgi:hypothetical protein